MRIGFDDCVDPIFIDFIGDLMDKMFIKISKLLVSKGNRSHCISRQLVGGFCLTTPSLLRTKLTKINALKHFSTCRTENFL